LDVLSRKRRVPRAQDRLSRSWPLPGPLSARPERTASPVRRRALDYEYDDKSSCLRRRNGPSRIHSGLHCYDTTLELQVSLECLIPPSKLRFYGSSSKTSERATEREADDDLPF